MDTLAHGLWTNVVYVRADRRSRLWAIFLGVAPDLFSFGPFVLARLITNTFSFRATPPALVVTFYELTHSLVIWAIVFVVVAIVRGWRAKQLSRGIPWQPWWPLLAWGLHIVVDVFTHSLEYFPTPFLFPFSDFRVNAVSWATPTFMLINYTLLAVAYLFIYARRRKTV